MSDLKRLIALLGALAALVFGALLVTHTITDIWVGAGGIGLSAGAALLAQLL